MDRVRNVDLRGRLKQEGVLDTVKKRQQNWKQKVEKMSTNRVIKKIYNGEIPGRRPRGRPRCGVCVCGVCVCGVVWCVWVGGVVCVCVCVWCGVVCVCGVCVCVCVYCVCVCVYVCVWCVCVCMCVCVCVCVCVVVVFICMLQLLIICGLYRHTEQYTHKTHYAVEF